MNIDPHQDSHQDSQIDQVLQALRRSSPPEGMEARIAARVAQQIASPAPTRSGLASFIPTASWWRGAATGTAFALLIVAVVLSIEHRTPARDHNRQAVAKSPRPVAITVSQSMAADRPCPHPVLLSKATPSVTAIPAQLAAQSPLSESAAPSHPAPVLPLTPQERELARLVRNADPRQLAALGAYEEARLEAERASELSRFVTQPAASQAAPPSPPDAPTPAEPAPTAPAESVAPTPSPDQVSAPNAIDPNTSTNQEDQK